MAVARRPGDPNPVTANDELAALMLGELREIRGALDEIRDHMRSDRGPDQVPPGMVAVTEPATPPAPAATVKVPRQRRQRRAAEGTQQG